MSTAVEEIELRKAGGKVQKPSAQNTNESSTKGMNPIEELRRQAEMAYTTYQGAQRKVASAYRQREQEEVKVYKLAEQEANRVCDEEIGKALEARTLAERNARESYEKTLEKAKSAYEESVIVALRTCRETIEQRWQVAREFSDQIWSIFQGSGIK